MPQVLLESRRLSFSVGGSVDSIRGISGNLGECRRGENTMRHPQVALGLFAATTRWRNMGVACTASTRVSAQCKPMESDCTPVALMGAASVFRKSSQFF